MTALAGIDWAVIAGGLGAIAWVNWYFFHARPATASAVAHPAAGGVQEVEIQVKGGYSPSTVRVRHGRPVRLVFDRQEASSCSEELVLGDFGIRRFLAPFQKTVVELTPNEPGTHDFTCGMGMLHGRLEVE